MPATRRAPAATLPDDLPLFAYRRVSSMGKRKVGDPDFHSVDDQDEEIKRWAGDRHEIDWSLPPELDGKGDDPDRPILQRARAAVRAGTHRGVVTAYLSRGGRDLRMMLDVWHEVEDVAGGEFWSARENLSGKTRHGRTMRNIFMAMHQDELERLRDDFNHRREEAVRNCVWSSRIIPYGYRKDTRKGSPTYRQLVPYEPEAERLRQAARDYLRGVDIQTLAERLGLTASGLRQRFRSRVSLGELRHGEYVNETAYTPIMDPELFDAVVAKLDAHVRGSKHSDGVPALLAKLATCEGCKHLMTRKSTSDAFYACEGRHWHCPEPASIRCSRLDAYVEAIALPELERIRLTATASTRGIEQARRDVQAAEAELDAYVAEVKAADLKGGAFAAGAKQRHDAVLAAKARLSEMHAQSAAMPAPGSGAEAYAEMNGHERNALLRALLAGVVVKRGGRWVPLDSRVRVIAYGHPVEWQDFGADGVLGPPPGEDAE